MFDRLFDNINVSFSVSPSINVFNIQISVLHPQWSDNFFASIYAGFQ